MDHTEKRVFVFFVEFRGVYEGLKGCTVLPLTTALSGRIGDIASICFLRLASRLMSVFELNGGYST